MRKLFIEIAKQQQLLGCCAYVCICGLDRTRNQCSRRSGAHHVLVHCNYDYERCIAYANLAL